jgi:hypothetical protein
MVLIGQGLEFMSRDIFEYLCEYGIMMCQGLDLLQLQCLVALTL